MYKGYGWGLLLMAILSPLGLLAKGTAWGEWGTDEIGQMVGYVPAGMEKAAAWWQALFPDYAIEVLGTGKLGEITGYIISAVAGGVVIYAVTVAVGRLAVKRDNPTASAPRYDG